MTNSGPYLAESETPRLSDTDMAALRLAGAGQFVTSIPPTTEKDHMGSVTPGSRIYKRLINLGLILITDEEWIETTDDDGTTVFVDLTPMLILTERGERILATQERRGTLNDCF